MFHLINGFAYFINRLKGETKVYKILLCVVFAHLPRWAFFYPEVAAVSSQNNPSSPLSISLSFSGKSPFHMPITNNIAQDTVTLFMPKPA